MRSEIKEQPTTTLCRSVALSPRTLFLNTEQCGHLLEGLASSLDKTVADEHEREDIDDSQY